MEEEFVTSLSIFSDKNNLMCIFHPENYSRESIARIIPHVVSADHVRMISILLDFVSGIDELGLYLIRNSRVMLGCGIYEYMVEREGSWWWESMDIKMMLENCSDGRIKYLLGIYPPLKKCMRSVEKIIPEIAKKRKIICLFIEKAEGRMMFRSHPKPEYLW